MNKAYVLVHDGAAQTALAESNRIPNLRRSVHVRNSLPPNDVLTVDGWWVIGEDGSTFHYMDGDLGHEVEIPAWQVDGMLKAWISV